KYEQHSNMGIAVGHNILYTILFADCQVIIAADEDDASYMFRKLKEEYESWSLLINMTKTEYLRVEEQKNEINDLKIKANTIKAPLSIVSWEINKQQKGRLISTEMDFSRRSCAISRMDRVRNDTISELMGVAKTTMDTIETKQLQWRRKSRRPPKTWHLRRSDRQRSPTRRLAEYEEVEDGKREARSSDNRKKTRIIYNIQWIRTR
ncbi:hypothetical protein ILUMI_11190, partial [Ignelater luminosus]